VVSTRRFEAHVQTDEESGGCYVEVPLDVRTVFGRARAPVRVTVGSVTWRSTVAVYGGRSYLPLRREIREAAGVAPGDVVQVELASDEEPRTVEPPSDLAEALAGDADAQALFETLSYTHRRDYVRWVEDAKRAETRARRVGRAVELLRAGKRSPR
jgi:hypothetical protein